MGICFAQSFIRHSVLLGSAHLGLNEQIILTVFLCYAKLLLPAHCSHLIFYFHLHVPIF